MSIFDNDRADEPAAYEDGVYFHMPEADYHSLPRLSASGMKNMLISVPTFWAKSWMNPDNDDEEEQEDTKAQILGRAYHVAIFEPETLDQRYVSEPDLSGIKNLLTSDAAVCAELKALGQTQKKAGESPVMRALRLMELEPSFNVKSVIMGEFEEAISGRQVIAAKYWQQIMRDIERIADNPEIFDLVSNGASEVTILWTCPDSGLPMKARIDKLKPHYFLDLKSFANSNGKPVNMAIRDQVQFYKYYLSMRVYQTAISMIAKLELQAMDGGTDRQAALLADLAAKKAPHQPWLFFQEKGGIPNLLARRLKLQVYPDGTDVQSIGAEDHDIKAHDSVLARKADLEIARAKQLFSMAMEIYGPDQEWYPLDMIGEMGDEDFSDWFLDGVPA